MANGTLKVQNIETSSGSGTITLGQSGETLALGASNISGFGKIGQVIQVVNDTETIITSTSYADTSLSASIVPSSTSSKILVKVIHQCFISRSSTSAYGGIKLLRNTTEIFNPTSANGTGPYSNGINVNNSGANLVELYWYSPLEYLDSPNTTSSITYKTQARVYNSANNGRFIFNDNSTGNDGKSVITLMEILP